MQSLKMSRRQSIRRVALCFHLLLVVAFSAQSLAGQASESNASTSFVAREALKRLKGVDLDSNPGLKQAVMRVLDSVRGRAEFVGIVRDFSLSGQEESLLDFSVNHPESPVAVDAIRLILKDKDAEWLQPTLTGDDPKLQKNLIRVLGHIPDSQVILLLLTLAFTAERPIELRRSALRSLGRTQAGARVLLEKVRENELPDELRFTAGQVLRGTAWPGIRSTAFELLPPPILGGDTALPSLAQLQQLKGNPVNGKNVFFRPASMCSQCHKVRGEGINVGPDLSEIGGKLAPEALYEAILDPNAGISFGYEGWSIEWDNGESTVGIVVSETAKDLELKTLTGLVNRYLKEAIVDRQPLEISLMPPNLQASMTVIELVDLVAYLGQLQPQ